VSRGPLQQGFRFGIEPSAFRVGDITEAARRLEQGVHRIAEARGVSLWAEVVNGRAVDFRAFDEDGEELGIVHFIEPDRRAGPPSSELLRSPREQDAAAADRGS
jgi:hypothetical protein